MIRCTNIRLLILCSLLLSGLFVSQQAAGQIAGYEPNVVLKAQASVINNLSLTTIRDVTLEASSSVDGILTIAPERSPYAGLIRIDGTPNAQVRVTYLTAETLIDEDGSGATIRSTYRLSGFANDNQFASVILDVGEANIRLGGDGKYYLWLGAILDLSNAGPGSYTSDFIIEIEGN